MLCAKTKHQLAKTTEELSQYKQLMNAIDSNVARIDFTPQGYVLNANNQFLETMGYGFNEVQRQWPFVIAPKDSDPGARQDAVGGS